MPMPVDWPRLLVGDLVHRHVGQRAGARDDADLSRRWMREGMIPTLHLPGEMIPGQFGPIRREVVVRMKFFTLTMSSTGMPSLMQTIRAIPARAASMMASAAKAAGTKMTDTSAAVSAHRLLHGIENGLFQVDLPALARGDAADDARTVFHHLRGMKRAFAPGESLDDHPGILIDQNGHGQSPLASSTTRRTASARTFSVTKFNCDSRRILMPSSSLVPTRRMTIGILMSRPLTA